MGVKEAEDGQQQQVPSTTTIKALSVPFNRNMQSNECPGLHLRQQKEETVLEQQAQFGDSVQHVDLGCPQQQQDEEQQQMQQLEQKHTAEMLRVSQQHDTALAELQEQLRAAEENVVLLNLRTQRLEGTCPISFPQTGKPSHPFATHLLSSRSAWNV